MNESIERHPILQEMIAISVVSIAMTFLVHRLPVTTLSQDAREALAAAVVLVAALVTVAAFNWWQRARVSRSNVSDATGIVAIFQNLNACEADMVEAYRAARDCSLFLQIGRRAFGNSEASSFYELTLQKQIPGARLRILRASDDSPFLSEEAARHRKLVPTDRWKIWLDGVGREIGVLKATSKVDIHEREHREPFLWRIFIFDDIAYVSAYLHPRENDARAPVYKIRKGDNSLYGVFEKYFDYLWTKYEPQHVIE
jgi:hypothetical protein